ncbi:MAG TPA: lipoate--protein ligase family protein [Chlamydiales bacterium]|nr:lipoate--protein ligase family protein [Chlamydiales bacterium]
MSHTPINLLLLENFPILEQLKVEEALLRADSRNFCIINTGSPKSIIMGISSKPEELVDYSKLDQNIPVIRRYSGGGCVIADHNTIFVSFLLAKDFLSLPPFPEPLLRWTGDFYRDAFGISNFMVRENDFVIGEKKCGGNAQYIKKDRSMQHTSFLWDYHPETMNILLHPKKTPKYRENRPHEEFLCKLKAHFPEKKSVQKRIVQELKKRFAVIPFELEQSLPILALPHRKATHVI